MQKTIENYTKDSRTITSIKTLLYSILITFLATTIIYSINTYYYQASKYNKAEVISTTLLSSIEKNMHDIDKIKYIIAKHKVEVTLSNESDTLTLKGKTLNEYPKSNYFIDSKKKMFSSSNKYNSLNYIFKKRIGNVLYLDVWHAGSFSISIYLQNKLSWYKYRIYQKSLVFYSYFIVVFIGIFISSRIFKKLTQTNERKEKQLHLLETNYKLTCDLMNKEANVNFTNELDEIKEDYIKKINLLNKKYHLDYKNNDNVPEEDIPDKINADIILDDVISIEGKQHIEEFTNAIETAQESIYVLSGWISTYVLTEHMITRLNNALSRGVNIYVGFGWGTNTGQCYSLHDLKIDHKRALNLLFQLKNAHNNNDDTANIFIGFFPNHQKILLKDSEFIICGSNNWLSNASFKNLETSYKVSSEKLIQSEQIRIKNLIHENSVNHCS